MSGTAVHFRLDDDDALAMSYIARLRQISQTLPPSTHISFPSGIMLFPSGRDEPSGASMPHQRFLTAIGLATVNSAKFTKNPFQMMHSNVWTRWPVVSDPSFPAFIRTQHFANDTAAKQDRIISGLQRERFSRRATRYTTEVEAMLAQHYPFLTREIPSSRASGWMTFRAKAWRSGAWPTCRPSDCRSPDPALRA